MTGALRYALASVILLAGFLIWHRPRWRAELWVFWLAAAGAYGVYEAVALGAWRSVGVWMVFAALGLAIYDYVTDRRRRDG